EPDMTHLALVGEREQVLIDLALAQCRDRERGHEHGPAAGQDRTQDDAALAQPADQLQALIGGDAAGYNQQDALAGQNGRSPAPGGASCGTRKTRVWRPLPQAARRAA